MAVSVLALCLLGAISENVATQDPLTRFDASLLESLHRKADLDTAGLDRDDLFTALSQLLASRRGARRGTDERSRGLPPCAGQYANAKPSVGGHP